MTIGPFHAEKGSPKTAKADLLASAAKQLILFEKEKGGTGSTGTLVTVAHVAREKGLPRVFIECSVMQNDVLNSYGGHETVDVVDLTASNAGDLFLKAVIDAPPGAVILANVPGGRIDTLERVHRLIEFMQRRRPDAAPVVTIVWTMGLDMASRTTLDALLESELPGRLMLNLPQWWGDRDAFEHVDDALIDRVRATGGDVFQTVEMPAHLYNLFRAHEVAIDLLPDTPGFDFGNAMALELWAEDAAASIEGLL